MALIEWQTSAKRHLRQIFDYYKEQASLTAACTMRDTIVSSVDRLEDFPTSGVRDHVLSTEETTYYYVLAKRGKKTYRVYYIYEKDVCYIQAIWDCSMNPTKRRARVIPFRRRK